MDNKITLAKLKGRGRTLQGRGRTLSAHKKENGSQRGKVHSTARWRKLAKQVKSLQLFCKMCGVAPSTIADHIREVDHSEPSAGDLDINNCWALCDPCHGIKTDQVKRGVFNYEYVLENAAGKELHYDAGLSC